MFTQRYRDAVTVTRTTHHFRHFTFSLQSIIK